MDVKNVYEATLKEVGLVFNNFNWESTPHYVNWLAQSYYYIASTTRIISLTASRVSWDRPDMHKHFLHYIREEQGHDLLAIRDLNNLGSNIESFEPTFETKALYRSQFYWLLQDTPMSVLGYYLFLEGLSIEHGPMMYERILKTYGKKSVNFVKVHVEEDVSHVKNQIEIINKLSDFEINRVIENMKDTQKIYCAMIEKCNILANQMVKAA